MMYSEIVKSGRKAAFFVFSHSIRLDCRVLSYLESETIDILLLEIKLRALE